MKEEQVKRSLILLLTAFIWGTSFVAQSVGMEHVEPFTFICIRSIIGGVFLSCFIFLSDQIKKVYQNKHTSVENFQQKESSQKERNIARRNLLMGGVLCGVILFFATNLQQFGISYTTVGKTGFITALYIIMVPIISIFLGKKCTPFVWLGVIFALCGMYFLCMTEGFGLQLGDFLVLLCAVAFSVHILVIDYYTPLVDGVKMSCIQFLVCGILSAIGMFVFETPELSQIWAAKGSILYAGIFSCGVAYTLQIVGQKGMNPTVASLILSLESVISALSGVVVLGETLSSRELFGCLLMFAAILLAQIPMPISRKKVSS